MEEDDILGIGAQLWLTSAGTPGTLTKIEGLLNINRPNLSIDSVDTTDHDSEGGVREFMAGLGDPGELTATVKYRPGSPTDDLLLEHLASRKKRPFKIVTPTAAGPTEDHLGVAFLLTYEPDDAPLDGVRTATITGKVSGAVTQAATTP